jgi:putative hydrolase of the HAD superfamily
VIFDFGNVVSLPPSPADRAAITRLAGIGGGDGEDGPFWAAYDAHRSEFDRGTGGVAYWQAIAGDIGARWDSGLVSALWAADFRSWLPLNPAVVEVLADLRAGGTPLALLSNAAPEYGGFFRHGPVSGFFCACYVSGELGLLKPDPEIYQHVLADLGITPGEAVFVDDRPDNVAGAEALGVAGHVFTGAAELRSFLASLAMPVPCALTVPGPGTEAAS